MPAATPQNEPLTLTPSEPNTTDSTNSGISDYADNLRSRLGTFSDRSLRRHRRDDTESSPAGWLGVAEDFDARKEGEAIGTWDNFNDDDDDAWRGGAYGGETFEDDVSDIQTLSSELLDKEVWLVALGAGEMSQAGVHYFLNRHDRSLKGSLVISVLGVGAGDLCYTILEGGIRSRRTDQRLQNLFAQAAQELAVPLAPVVFTAFETDGAAVLRYNSRAISLIGMSDGIPHNWRKDDDSSRDISEDKINLASELILETIKNS
jgi:hypothetical protein